MNGLILGIAVTALLGSDPAVPREGSEELDCLRHLLVRPPGSGSSNGPFLHAPSPASPAGRGSSLAEREPSSSVPFASSSDPWSWGEDVRNRILPPPPGTILCPEASSVSSSEARSRGEAPGLTPARAFLYSTLVPGMSQGLMDQRRWVGYLGIEIAAWIQVYEKRRRGEMLRRRYRDLAWNVARRVASGPRVEGDWAYYEALSKFPASGVFDSDPSQDGIQPELDPDTYNGHIWALALQIYLSPEVEEPDTSDPGYRQALQYYRQRAYPEEFTWDWGENGRQQSVYRDLIRTSDEVFRRGTHVLGIIIANHLISAMDALVSARLGLEAETRSAGPELGVVPLDLASGRWSVVVRLNR